MRRGVRVIKRLRAVNKHSVLEKPVLAYAMLYFYVDAHQTLVGVRTVRCELCGVRNASQTHCSVIYH